MSSFDRDRRRLLSWGAASGGLAATLGWPSAAVGQSRNEVVLLLEADPDAEMGRRLSTLAPALRAAAGGNRIWIAPDGASLRLSAPSAAVSEAQEAALSRAITMAGPSSPDAETTEIGLADLTLARVGAASLSLAAAPAAAARLETAILEETADALRARLAAHDVSGRVVRTADRRIRIDAVSRSPVDWETLLRPGRLAFHFEHRADAVSAAETNALSHYSEWIAPPYSPFMGAPPDGSLRLEASPALDAPEIESAKVAFGPDIGAGVDIALGAAAATLFAAVSSKGVGRRLALLVDGEIALAPYLVAPIRDGRLQVSGAFTPEEARRLALVLGGPPLPAPLTVLERR